ncbi:unnamed protein product [Linum trigynum]|uniref:Uncharacterized protein n=1 Tax=Linum trigynum TaxID=586398 RepID=A0AAV2CD12_9ROSI
MIRRRAISNRKRKRLETLGEAMEFSDVVYVKKGRKSILKGWRFWLPPSPVLDGEALSPHSIPTLDERRKRPDMVSSNRFCGIDSTKPFGEDGLVKPSGNRVLLLPTRDDGPSPSELSNPSSGKCSDAVAGSNSSATGSALSREARSVTITPVGIRFGIGQNLGFLSPKKPSSAQIKN